MIQTTIWVTTSFVAFHRWVAAPTYLLFLRQYHRHVFHVKLGVRVVSPDREVEFFTLKANVEKHIASTYAGFYFNLSCEQIAQQLLEKFSACFCEVSEDGENGAWVERVEETQAPLSLARIGDDQ